MGGDLIGYVCLVQDKATGFVARYEAWGTRMKNKIIKADWFRNLRDAIIIINIIMLGMKYYGESQVYADVLRTFPSPFVPSSPPLFTLCCIHYRLWVLDLFDLVLG